MANQDVERREQGTKAQQDFKNAGNGNVIRQAGEGLEAARAATPTPGSRLTAKEVEAEAGHAPGQGSAETKRAPGAQTNASVKAEEREALRRQGNEETDSDLERGTRTEGTLGVEDPVITANPD